MRDVALNNPHLVSNLKFGLHMLVVSDYASRAVASLATHLLIIVLTVSYVDVALALASIVRLGVEEACPEHIHRAHVDEAVELGHAVSNFLHQGADRLLASALARDR